MSDTIHLDVVTDWDQRSVHQSALEIQSRFGRAGRDASQGFTDNYAAGIEKGRPRIEKAYAKILDASGDVVKAERGVAETRAQIARQSKSLTDAENRLTDARKDGASDARTLARAEREVESARTRLDRTTTTLVNRSESLRKAHRNEESAARDLARSMTDVDTTARGAVSQLAILGTTLGGLGRVATPVVVAGAVSGIAQLTAVAASATQALWVMPGAIGAAASAFGTLKLATLGFGDALADIRDPEKFAAALQSLSPNAQQAALSIQALMPELDKLKNATQDALFAGVGDQLNRLATEYLPTIQGLTTGIAGSFNQMFAGVADQLMTPETMASMQTFATNTAAAFNNLAPAAGKLVSAFADMSAVGSEFLPDIAASAADAAASFADFIREAQNSGELKQWLGEGLQTLREVWPAVEAVGGAFMDLAPIGREVLPDVVAGIQGLADILPGVVDFATQLAPAFGEAGAALSWLAEVGDTAFKDLEDSGVSAFGAIGDSVARVLNPINAVIDAVKVAGNLLGFDMGGPTASAVDNAQRSLDAAIAEMRNPGWGGPPAYFPGQNSYSGGGSFAPPGSASAAGIPWDSLSPADKWLRADASAHGGNSGGLVPGMPGFYRRRDGSIGYAAPPSAQDSIPTPPIASGGGAGASSPAPGVIVTPGNAQAAIQYAAQQSGKPYGYGGVGDPLYDCSGYMSDLFAIMTGRPYTGSERFFTTESDFTKLGFEPGFRPGAFNIGVHRGGGGPNSHMAGTLPNGVNVESGGRAGLTQYGGSAAGADDPQFELQYHLPVDQAFNSGYGVPQGLMDSGPTPVSVENFGPSAQQSIGQIGAALDSDFGLSNGLPGLLDNLTRMLANLAFAPVVGALSGVQAGMGFQPGSAGYGLMGMAAPGMATPFAGSPGAAYYGAPSVAPAAAIGPAPIGGGVAPLPGAMPSAVAPAPGMAPGAQPFGMPAAPGQPQSSVIAGGQGGAPPGTQGGGYAGLGGLPMAAIQTGISAAGAASPIPGAGQAASAAAQMAIEMINRTAGFAGQAAAIAGQGLLETFSLSGSGPLTDPLKTLPGRLLAGFAGARPALPNMAGQSQQAGAPKREDMERGADAVRAKQGGPMVNIEQVNQAPNQTPDSVANGVANQFRSIELSQGFRSR